MKKLKLFACGDYVNSKGIDEFLSNDLKNDIHNCDFAICNFEAPIFTNENDKIKKAGPYVAQSNESVKSLHDAGFNYVSIANNHIYDYGDNGLVKTITELSKYNIEYVGGGLNFDESYKYKILTKNGIKIGLISACQNEFGCHDDQDEISRGGYAWILHNKIEDNIRELRQKVDFLVVICHAGVEDIDIPIKQWKHKYKRFCDIGADIIIGHHPHVPQGIEKYNKSTIFYSLGNFYFDSTGFENISDDSYSVIIDFYGNNEYSYDIIYHRKILGITTKVTKENVNFSLERLNKILFEGYELYHKELCRKLFEEYYLSYYEIAFSIPSKNSSIISKIKRLITLFLLRKRYKKNINLMLLHNIKIDSHLYVVQNYLKNEILEDN